MESSPPLGYRDRHREKRRREFLDVARRIINTEGHDALTMQRVTEAVGSSTGGIYIYFASKDVLMAELQREAFDVMVASYLLGQSQLDAVLEERGADLPAAALARAVATCRFWIDSEETLPGEIELSRRLIAGATAPMAQPGEGVLPAALRLLDEGRQRLDAAVEAGVLDPGNSLERAVMLVASMTGVLLTSKLGGWDTSLFDGRHLATGLVSDILVGWGATREQLAVADAHLAAFAKQHHVAPPVDPARVADSSSYT